jgi:ABC-type molybdate transport system substrate-binding protein
MAFTTSSNFSGNAAGFYISAALKEAKSLEYLTMIENIKFKSNIQKQALSGVLADATCDFTGCWNSCND